MRLRHIPSFRDLDQAVVGLVATVVAVVLVTGAFAVGALRIFDDTYRLTAVFDSTGGIKTNADVRLAGVDVGQVTGIHPDFERGQVILTLEIDAGVEIGPEVEAEVAAATLLGGYYVRLDGPVTEPILESLERDDPRRRIPLERTRGPISLVSTLSDTTSAIQAIDIEAVNQVIADLAGATDRNRDVVPRVIENLTRIGAAVSARDAELERLIANSEAVAGALAERDDQILELMDAATVLLTTLEERRTELATVLGSGSAAVVELTDTITTHRAALDAILADVHVILEGVERNTSVINTSLAYAGPLFALLGATADDQGGFNVAVEGFVLTVDQLRGLLGLLFPAGGV